MVPVTIFSFSKKGDGGETSLLSGERVSKGSLRPETYGTLDEAGAALGLAKALCTHRRIREMIETVQSDLLVLGAELACESEARKEWLLERERIVRLESWIEELQQEVPLPRKFVLAGENPVSAALDLARTIVRRAERRAAALKEEGFRVRAEAASYLNRLADFLFTLARYAAEKAE